MAKKIIYFTLEKKLTLSFGLLFITFLVIFILIFLVLIKQNSDALTINLLGKQSLYFQKIEKQLLVIKYLNNNDKELRTTIKEIDNYLKALRDRGIISNSVRINRVTDKSVFTQLIILIRLWDEYKSILEYYLQTKDEGLFQSALDKNERLINEATKATNLMQDASLIRVALIRYTLISGLFIFLIVYLVSKKIIHNFICNLNIFINYFELGSLGDFSNYLSLKSKDETQKLSVFFNNFIEKLVYILNQIKTTVKNNTESFKILNQKTESTSIAINSIFDNSKTTLENSIRLSNNYEKMSSEISNIEELIIKLNNEIKSQKNTSTEVNDITKNLIDNINKLREKSLESQKEIMKIKQMIGDGQQGLNSFRSWIFSINNSIEEVAQMIFSVHKIIEKTSILAMNAAIEAAHAEEYGSGFSIVADEVRKLSEQEEENINQIDTNLQKIQNEIITTNESVEKTINTISTILQTNLSFSDFQNFINLQIDSIAQDGNKVMDIINKSLELTSFLSNLSGIISNHVENINENLIEVKEKIDSNDSNVKKINDQIEMIKKSVESFIEIETTNKILIEKLNEMISIFKLPSTNESVQELDNKSISKSDNKLDY